MKESASRFIKDAGECDGVREVGVAVNDPVVDQRGNVPLVDTPTTDRGGRDNRARGDLVVDETLVVARP